MATDLSDQIEQAASDPQSAAVDGQSATARPMGDLIAADQYLAAKAGMARRRRGVRFTKILASGPVSDQGQTRPLGSFGGGGGLI
jgi:hypothetical protein